MAEAFNKEQWYINLKGKKYLPVAARLVWFRQEHPDWGIVTQAIDLNEEKQYAIFQCSIFNEQGRVIATAHKKEDRQGFPDYMEKAETGSVGRALGMCGYGTHDDPDFDEGSRLADAPIRLPEPKQVLAPEQERTNARLDYMNTLRSLGHNVGTEQEPNKTEVYRIFLRQTGSTFQSASTKELIKAASEAMAPE